MSVQNNCGERCSDKDQPLHDLQAKVNIPPEDVIPLSTSCKFHEAPISSAEYPWQPCCRFSRR